MSRLNEKRWTAHDDDLLRFHFATRGPWGVDAEEAEARRLGVPVFYSLAELLRHFGEGG